MVSIKGLAYALNLVDDVILSLVDLPNHLEWVERARGLITRWLSMALAHSPILVLSPSTCVLANIQSKVHRPKYTG